MKAKLLVIVAIGLLLAADKKDDAAKAGREKLQGTWTPVEARRYTRLIIAGDGFTIKEKDKDVYKGTFKVDPSKTPSTIDMMITDDNEKGDFKGKTSLGIYELDGDKLKWCVNEPGKNERPKQFLKEADEPRYLQIQFKREKP